MRKVFILFLFFIAFFIGCIKKNEAHSLWKDSGKLRVLSTIPMIEDLVKEIGGDYVESVCLIPRKIDPHSYTLVKGDDEKLKGADLIFYNGLGLEHGASLSYYLTSHQCAVGLGEVLLERHRDKLIFIDGQVDPHIWMDLAIFSYVVESIVENLVRKEPLHEIYFRERGRSVQIKMEEMDQRFLKCMREIPSERRCFVTCHEAFHYFVRRYLSLSEEDGEKWKARFQAPEGLNPEGQLSFLDIQKVSDFICCYRIPYLFPESNISLQPLQKIVSVCRERGHSVILAEVPLYADTMETDSYFEMMEHNMSIFLKYAKISK